MSKRAADKTDPWQMTFFTLPPRNADEPCCDTLRRLLLLTEQYSYASREHCRMHNVYSRVLSSKVKLERQFNELSVRHQVLRTLVVRYLESPSHGLEETLRSLCARPDFSSHMQRQLLLRADDKDVQEKYPFLPWREIQWLYGFPRYNYFFDTGKVMPLL